MKYISQCKSGQLRCLVAFLGVILYSTTLLWSSSKQQLPNKIQHSSLIASYSSSANTHGHSSTSNQHHMGITRSVKSTGIDLQLSECGASWDAYYNQLPPGKTITFAGEQNDHVFQWTVSGGEEYKENAAIILQKWKTLGFDPVLVVALEEETAQLICDAGFYAVFWSADKASYSRVADAKFGVAAALAERNYHSFFMEMDIFCRKNPVPHFLQLQSNGQTDLINIGHGHVNYYINIGAYLASPRVGPFFRGLTDVLRPSLHHDSFINNQGGTDQFFDQKAYMDCLPPTSNHPNEDDDVVRPVFEWYLANDTEKSTDLLKSCKAFSNFTHQTVHHHIMNCLAPPIVYDSTLCIHPLASQPFSSLQFKLGVAKFYGMNPKPIGKHEKLLKLSSGDIEFNSCWRNRAFSRHQLDPEKQMRVQFVIAALVELADATNRTLVLPRYVRDNYAWAVPTHAIVNIATLPSYYSVIPEAESYQFLEEQDEDSNRQVIFAGRNYSETYRRVLAGAAVKVLEINKICNMRDEELPSAIKQRVAGLKWCFDKDLKWSEAIGSWVKFCQAE